jgi:hypothetical protein
VSETVGVTVSRNTVAKPRKATRHNTRCLGGVALSRCHDARPTAPQVQSPSVVPSLGHVPGSLGLPSRGSSGQRHATSCATNAVSGGIRKRAHGLWQRTTNPRQACEWRPVSARHGVRAVPS